MKNNSPNRVLQHIKDYKEFVIFLALFLIFYFLASYFDFFESLNTTLIRREPWELDEIIGVTSVSFFAIFALSLYRSTKLRRERQARKKIEQELEWKNKNLEILNTVTQAAHESSSLDEIYNIALDMTTELERVDMIHIYLVDKDREEAIQLAHRNLPEDYIRRAGRIPYPQGVTWKVINTGEILNIDNVQTDPDIGPAGRDLGHHSALGVPITSEKETIGVIWFLSYKEQRFGEDEVRLLTSVGDQIATAIAKAKLYGDLARKSRYEEIIRTVTQNVHSSIDLKKVLESAANSLITNIDAADNIAIYMVEGGEAVLQTQRGLTDSFIKRAARIPHPRGFTWKTILEGKPRYCADTDKDEDIGPAGRKEGIRSYLSMPIAYDGKTAGCININSKQKNALDEEELKLLEIVSHQISIAIGNAKHAEALRESEEKYRTLYDQSPLGVCLIDRDLKITHCNASMVRIFQSSRDRIIGLDLHTLKDQAFVPVIEDALNGGIGTLESPYKATTSSADIWLSVKTVPLYDNENNVYSVMGVVEDITKRKLDEAALTESENRHRTIVEQTYDMTIECDALGTILYANPRCKDIMGYDPEELTGTNFLLLVHEDERSIAIADFQKGLQNMEIVQPKIYRCRHKNGDFKWIESTGKAFKTAAGKIHGFVSARDITERKMSEEALLRIQKSLSEAQRIAHLGNWEMDIRKNKLLWSDEVYRIFGFTPQEFDPTYEAFLSFVHPDDREFVQKSMNEALYEGNRYGIDFRIISQDGSERIVYAQGEVSFDDNGKPVRMFGTAHDITERKLMEEELLKSQKLESLSILAGGIAHDFNNLLSIILGNVNIAKMKLAPHEESSKRLTEAEKAIQRATGLTRQLLTFAKGGEPYKKSVDIDKLIKESTLFALRGSNIDCVFSIEDDLLPADIDEGQINQVINNLVINAQHAMPGGGSIEAGAKNAILEDRNVLNLPKGKYLEIYIKDSGVGIPKEHLQKIFDPFFTTKPQGSGLGLASSFSIIKQHNGHISVDSEPGRGTVFTIYLPALTEPSAVTYTEEDIPVKGRGRILVMDDEEMIRRIVGEMIEELGYHTEFAKDSSEAIKIYRDSMDSGDKIDAVILDLTIPGDIGGKETLKKLLDIDPDIKAIVSSGYSKDGTIADYMTYGFKAYMPKPYTMAVLSNVLHEVVMPPDS